VAALAREADQEDLTLSAGVTVTKEFENVRVHAEVVQALHTCSGQVCEREACVMLLVQTWTLKCQLRMAVVRRVGLIVRWAALQMSSSCSGAQ
jgi:hypothetical protein